MQHGAGPAAPGNMPANNANPIVAPGPADVLDAAAKPEVDDAMFAKDCGHKGVRYLSRKKVDVVLNSTHPRRQVDDGSTFVKFEVCSTHTGSHCSCGTRKSDLTGLGLGVSLYFKFVKHMAILLCIMATLVIPTIALFMGAETVSAQEDSSTGLVGLLKSTTLGQLGEGRSVCRDAVQPQRISIDCGSGSTIGLIEAYYGDPAGSCQCPDSQKPAPECPAKIIDGQCSPAGGYCFPASAREVTTPTGLTFEALPCCADQLVNGFPDFSSMDVKEEKGCQSSTAQLIASEMCLGKQSCTLPTSMSGNFTWTADSSTRTCYPGPERDGVLQFGDRCISSFTAAGNFTSCPAAQKLFVVARCFETIVESGGLLFDKKAVAVFIGASDTAMIMVFIIGVWLLISAERRENEAYDSATVSADDFSIQVTNLPKGLTGIVLNTNLKEHFERVLTADPPSIFATMLAAATNSTYKAAIKVASVFSVTNMTAKLIPLLKRRGSVVKKIAKLALKRSSKMHKLARKQAKRGQADHPPIDVPVAEETVKLMAKLKELDERISAVESEPGQAPSCAYITFQDEEGMLRALEQFNKPGCFFKSSHKFQGKKLKVIRAPQPSDIIWENLSVSSTQRCLRGLATFMVTLLLLLLSMGLVLFAENNKRAALLEFPPIDCSVMDDVSNKTLVIESRNYKLLGLPPPPAPGRLECFCKDLLFSSGPEALLTETFMSPQGSNGTITGYKDEKMCVSWLQAFTTIKILTYGASVVVLLANFTLRKVMRAMVNFERHRTRTRAQVSKFTKLFVSTAINIGVLVLLVNAKLNTSFELLQRGEHKDINARWFSSVGTSLLLTMTINIVEPHMWGLFRWSTKAWQRCCDRGCTFDKLRSKKKSQQGLEELYSGDTFPVAERYAQLVVALLVGVTYSTGLPLLLPITAISFILTYWVDKMLLLRFYRSPPRYTDQFAKRVHVVIPFILVLHLCMAIWTLGNPRIFPPDNLLSEATQATESLLAGKSGAVTGFLSSIQGEDSTITQGLIRLSSAHVLPLTLLLVLIIVGFVMYTTLWRLCTRRMLKAVNNCPCSCMHRFNFEFLPEYFSSIPPRTYAHALAAHSLPPSCLPGAREYAGEYHATSLADATSPQSTPRRTPRSSIAQRFLVSNPLREKEDTHSQRRRATKHMAALQERASKIDSLADGYREIQGMYTYDIHANPEYRAAFGLNQPLRQVLHRGLYWAQRGEEWEQQGVQVDRVPGKPHMWQHGNLMAAGGSQC